ncbi:MAG TPA: hypothetical protein V6C97_01220, partial [Oculatellaceae cyanobacterium]
MTTHGISLTTRYALSGVCVCVCVRVRVLVCGAFHYTCACYLHLSSRNTGTTLTHSPLTDVSL